MICGIIWNKNGLILSKEQAGKWAIENLNKNYISIINRALQSYRTDEIMNVDEKEAKSFCDYMLSKILK